MQAPILTYPRFDTEAPPFVLQTDASSVCVGAVLEQGGKVVAYASHTLTKAEHQYSVIQRVPGRCLWDGAISSLSFRQTFQTGHGSCPITVVVSTKDGGSALLMVASNSGIRLYYCLSERISQHECGCTIQVC